MQLTRYTRIYSILEDKLSSSDSGIVLDGITFKTEREPDKVEKNIQEIEHSNETVAIIGDGFDEGKNSTFLIFQNVVELIKVLQCEIQVFIEMFKLANTAEGFWK